MNDLDIIRQQASAVTLHAKPSAGAAFAQVLAATTAPAAAMAPRRVASAGIAANEPAGLRGLAHALDEMERSRVEANALAADVVGNSAVGTGSGAPVPVAMHRHARLMAAYTLDVMWSARLIGVAAGAIKQLVCAT